MTSFAFILGAVPLVIASGAGRGAAPGAGHRGVLRHDRGDRLRPALHPDLLRRLPRARRPARARRGDGPTLHGSPTLQSRPNEEQRTMTHSPRASPLPRSRSPACAVGPDYVAPDHAAGRGRPVRRRDSPGGRRSRRSPGDWWRLYHDPVLDRLVADALAANTDIRVAVARLARARAVAARGAGRPAAAGRHRRQRALRPRRRGPARARRRPRGLDRRCRARRRLRGRPVRPGQPQRRGGARRCRRGRGRCRRGAGRGRRRDRARLCRRRLGAPSGSRWPSASSSCSTSSLALTQQPARGGPGARGSTSRASPRCATSAQAEVPALAAERDRRRCSASPP